MWSFSQILKVVEPYRERKKNIIWRQETEKCKKITLREKIRKENYQLFFCSGWTCSDEIFKILHSVWVTALFLIFCEISQKCVLLPEIVLTIFLSPQLLCLISILLHDITLHHVAIPSSFSPHHSLHHSTECTETKCFIPLKFAYLQFALHNLFTIFLHYLLTYLHYLSHTIFISKI